MAKLNKDIRDRALEDRAYLTFEFYIPGRDALPLKFRLPFFENPRITESGSANYQTYNPIGRSSSLFSYLSSPSRRLNLSFVMTPDHIAQYGKGVNLDRMAPSTLLENKAEAKNSILTPLKSIYQTRRDQIPDHIAKFNKLIYGDESPETNTSDSVFQGIIALFSSDVKKDDNTKILEAVLWWVNLVRASVKNNNDNTIYGPPIVRLTFGPMYSEVPCICLNYDIEILEDRGLELRTLFPRGIRINMNLAEIRVGEFKEYLPTFKENIFFHRDAVAGWEAILDYGTFDPQGSGED